MFAKCLLIFLQANRNIVKVLGDVPNVKFGGANVNLTISTTSINLTVMETGKVRLLHSKYCPVNTV